LGAGLGQGYFFARPLTPEAFSIFLAGEEASAQDVSEAGAA
jgi:EAL domain-containing protein (putative c-di-GMP-specific phosphodiesterase class I)